MSVEQRERATSPASQTQPRIRVLVLGANVNDRRLWGLGAQYASISLDLVTEQPDQEVLDWTVVDICLIDSSFEEARLRKVVELARSLHPAPLVLLYGPRVYMDDAFADGHLRGPNSPTEAHQLLECCIRARLPTRVLVVDDSQTMRMIVRKTLQASRFSMNIEDAANGITAIELARSRRFGLIFLDYNMPGMNGFNILTELKHTRPQTAIVMITSAISNKIADRAHAAGAFAFLQKPFYARDIDVILQRYHGLIV